MRVLAIRGANLTSLAGEFSIDFEAPPLDDAGIFAITGPTGAGKSTLLDAMCLALFNRVPRLEAAASGKIGIAGGEMLSGDDPRAILRHRAPEGYAEVDFVGRDGGRYRARWTAWRARKRADGLLQESTHKFTDLTSGEALGGTRTETLEAIRGKVGLTVDQFGRAVMLAQGDFDAFVDADANERASLLERLTGTEIYARLGIAARRKADSLKAEIAVVQTRIEAQNGLDDVTRTAAEVTLAAAKSGHAEAQTELSVRERDRDWHLRAAALAERAVTAETTLTAVKDQQEKAAPRRIELATRLRAFGLVPQWRAMQEAKDKALSGATLVARLVEEASVAEIAARDAGEQEKITNAALIQASEALEAARPELEQARELDRRLNEIDGRLIPLTAAREARRDDATDAARLHDEAMVIHHDKRATFDELVSWRDARLAHSALSLRRDDLAADFADHTQYVEATGALTSEIEQVSIRLVALHQALTDAATTEQGLLLAHDAARAGLAQARADAPDGAVLARVGAERDRLQGLEPLLLGVENADDQLDRAVAALDQLRVEHEGLAGRLEQGRRRATEIATNLPALHARHEEAVRAAALSAAAAGEAAERLRATLVDGEPCPVCGASNHVLSALSGLIDGRADADAARVSELSAEIGALEREAAVIGDRIQQDEARSGILTQQSEVMNTRMATARLAWDGARSTLSTNAAACEIPVIDDLGALRDDIVGRIATLDGQRAVLQAAQVGLESARAAEEQARNRLAVAGEAHRKASIAVREVVTQKDALDVRIVETQRHRDRLAGNLDTLIGETFDWRTAREPLSLLDGIVTTWRDNAHAIASLEAELPKLASAVHAAELVRQKCAAAADTADREAVVQATDHAAATTKRAELLGGEAAGTVVARLENAVAVGKTCDATARASAAHARNSVAAAVARREQADIALAAERSDAESRSAALDAELADKQINEARVAAVAEAGEAALEQEAAVLAAIDQAVVVAQAEYASRTSDRDQFVASGTPALSGEALTQALVDAASAEKTARIALNEADLVIRQDDRARAVTAALRLELEQRHAAAHVWYQLDTLIGDATGAKFRRFAQGLNLDRLIQHANGRLSELKPRYTLERGQGGDMIVQVVDHDMAGEVRGLHNLSGGERFLVSLALALGLSEMSTGQGLRIESLFIDEGFGALDSASLGQAIGVLEQLHATGRRVGVISHIEEVKERIPVKIAVTPAARGRSIVEVLVN